MDRIRSLRLAAPAVLLAPLSAFAQTTSFETSVITALTTKVGDVTDAAAPYVALILGVWLVYRMVKRFSK